jgi:hypothetical protein
MPAITTAFDDDDDWVEIDSPINRVQAVADLEPTPTLEPVQPQCAAALQKLQTEVVPKLVQRQAFKRWSASPVAKNEGENDSYWGFGAFPLLIACLLLLWAILVLPVPLSEMNSPQSLARGCLVKHCSQREICDELKDVFQSCKIHKTWWQSCKAQKSAWKACQDEMIDTLTRESRKFESETTALREELSFVRENMSQVQRGQEKMKSKEDLASTAEQLFRESRALRHEIAQLRQQLNQSVSKRGCASSSTIVAATTSWIPYVEAEGRVLQDDELKDNTMLLLPPPSPVASSAGISNFCSTQLSRWCNQKKRCLDGKKQSYTNRPLVARFSTGFSDPTWQWRCYDPKTLDSQSMTYFVGRSTSDYCTRPHLRDVLRRCLQLEQLDQLKKAAAGSLVTSSSARTAGSNDDSMSHRLRKRLHKRVLRSKAQAHARKQWRTQQLDILNKSVVVSTYPSPVLRPLGPFRPKGHGWQLEMNGSWSNLSMANAPALTGHNCTTCRSLVPRGAIVTLSGALVTYTSPPQSNNLSLRSVLHPFEGDLLPVIIVNHTPVTISRPHTHNDMFRAAQTYRPLVQLLLQQQSLRYKRSQRYQKLEERVQRRQRLRYTNTIVQQRKPVAHKAATTTGHRTRLNKAIRQSWLKYTGFKCGSIFDTLENTDSKPGMIEYWRTNWNISRTKTTSSTQTLTFVNKSSSIRYSPKMITMQRLSPKVPTLNLSSASSYLANFAWGTLPAAPTWSWALGEPFNSTKASHELTSIFGSGRVTYHDIVAVRNPPRRQQGAKASTEERWPKHKYKTWRGWNTLNSSAPKYTQMGIMAIE